MTKVLILIFILAASLAASTVYKNKKIEEKRHFQKKIEKLVDKELSSIKKEDLICKKDSNFILLDKSQYIIEDSTIEDLILKQKYSVSNCYYIKNKEKIKRKPSFLEYECIENLEKLEIESILPRFAQKDYREYFLSLKVLSLPLETIKEEFYKNKSKEKLTVYFIELCSFPPRVEIKQII